MKLIVKTAAREIIDLAAFHAVKAVTRNGRWMLAGLTPGVENPHVFAFTPREGGEAKCMEALEAIWTEMQAGADGRWADLTGFTIDPSDEDLRDCELTEPETSDDPPKGDPGVGSQTLDPGPRFVRMKLGDDQRRQVYRMTGRRIEKVEIGGDGTVAVFLEGPHE